MSAVAELLNEGITAMCVGMGTVLVFLCIMVVTMHIMSFVVGKLNILFPEVVPQPSGGKKSAISSNDEEVAVAVLMAMLKK